MFQKMMQWVRATLLRLLGQENTDLVISPAMETQIATWVRMYEDVHVQDTYSLGLPAFIAGEFARLVTLECDIQLTGTRGKWMDEQFSIFRDSLRPSVEYACALGGAVFKPYVRGDAIAVDVVQADAFFPTAFDTSRRLTGAVFSQQITRGGKIYTRLESHDFNPGTGVEVIQNRAFVSSSNASLGGEIALSQVPEWADITPEATIQNLTQPLFAYFRIPLANNKDRGSPLGVSVFAGAVPAIEQANAQYGRLLWEYEGGQLAVDVSEAAIRKGEDGGVQLDRLGQRLYRRSLATGDINFYHAFAPALRDASYLNGLNDLLRKIEMQSNLSFGTISDPSSVDKTATEVKMNKQRSFAAVHDIQRALETALNGLFYAMDKLAQLYGLGPAGDWQATYLWHDSILVDEDKAREQMRQDCRDGAAQWWEYRMRFYGESEAEAKKAVGYFENPKKPLDPFGLDGDGGDG